MRSGRRVVRKRTTGRLTALSIIYVLTQLFVLILGVSIFYFGRRPDAGASDASTLAQISQPLGIGLLAAAVAGLAAFGYVLLSDRIRNRMYILERFGFANVFDSNTDSIKGQYSARLNGSKQIDIMGLGLNSFRKDFANELVEWLPKAKIRILVLAPDYPEQYPYSVQRDKEERDAPGTINGHNQTLREWIQPLLDKHRDRLLVREYLCLPSITMIRIDKELFWSPYLIHRGAGSSPTFLVKRSGELFDVLADHFEEIWNSDTWSRPLLATTGLDSSECE